MRIISQFISRRSTLRTNPDTKVLVKNLFVDGDFMNRLYSLANFAPQMQDVQQTPQ